MKCPRCGHEEADRYRKPTEQGGAILRRHKCRSCTQVFLSAQVVVSGPLIGRLLPLLER